MNNTLLKLYCKLKIMMTNDEGQDLVEYALVIAIVSIAALTTLGTVSGAVTAVFHDITTAL
jgi:pilus assembly protein Flp/PilA